MGSYLRFWGRAWSKKSPYHSSIRLIVLSLLGEQPGISKCFAFLNFFAFLFGSNVSKVVFSVNSDVAEFNFYLTITLSAAFLLMLQLSQLDLVEDFFFLNLSFLRFFHQFSFPV